MYGLIFPREYEHLEISVVFESVTPSFEEALESWRFAKNREAVGDPLYSDPLLVMFSEDDRSVWTELQGFYSRSTTK